MKYLGGIIVVLYGVLAFSGWEPFTRQERGAVSGGAAGVARYRSGGFMGGK